MSPSSRRHAVAADRVFDGGTVHEGYAVVVEGARIVGLTPRRDLPAGVPVQKLPDGAWLAPGFVDVQVNGGGDVLLNDDPTPEGMSAIAAAHRSFGTTALLPTLITDRPDKMTAALRAAEAAVGANPGVLGLHLEGPFISPDKPGVHDPGAIRPLEDADVARLAAHRAGVTLVTLAPERAPPGAVAALAGAGDKRIALGHSMATYAETKAALAEGLSGFTHLFNAMRPLGSREPGPIGAALDTPGCWFGLIVDGEHVHPAMLRLALRGAGQPMLVTDAMPPVGGRHAGFTLYGQAIRVENGRCRRPDGTLAGAALGMADAVRNAVAWLDVPLAAALRMASAAPAAFLGLGDSLGRLAPGFRADMVAFEPRTVDVLETWVAGRPTDR